jgi:hypothetical protein
MKVKEMTPIHPSIELPCDRYNGSIIKLNENKDNNNKEDHISANYKRLVNLFDLI